MYGILKQKKSSYYFRGPAENSELGRNPSLAAGMPFDSCISEPLQGLAHRYKPYSVKMHGFAMWALVDNHSLQGQLSACPTLLFSFPILSWHREERESVHCSLSYLFWAAFKKPPPAYLAHTRGLDRPWTSACPLNSGSLILRSSFSSCQ